MARSTKPVDSLDTHSLTPANNVDEALTTDVAEREIAGNELSFESLQAMMKTGEIDVLDASALADQDGFIFLDTSRKRDLVGSPFFIVKVAKGFSKSYGTFATLWVITQKGNKLKVIDFGTGIKEQVLPLVDPDSNESRDGIAVFVGQGLRESSYDADPDTGRPGGTTYYLDTSGGDLPAGQL